MFLFPYGTNAPIYYWPITTVGMIVANIVIFILAWQQPKEVFKSLMLEIGGGIHPLQWLTCNFMHADIMHLLGNMISLWVFGIVVEGKLGACKTLFVYLGIGVLFGAVVQLLMLGASPTYGLGASAIIFGLMAMCLIWAPENEIQCLFVLVFFPFFRTYYFDVRIKIMVGLDVGLQLVILFFKGGALSSELFHALGAAVGFAVGIWMLKAGWVDCENWDFFSVRAGRHTMSEEERDKLDAETPQGKQLAAERVQLRRDKAASDIRRAISEGMPQIALRIHQRMQKEQPGWMLEEADLLLMIRALQGQKHWIESIPVMQEYIAQFPQKAALVQLKLAQILLVEDKRPRKALKVLDQVNKYVLDDRQLELFRKLRAKADEMYGQDSYELMEE